MSKIMALVALLSLSACDDSVPVTKATIIKINECLIAGQKVSVFRNLVRNANSDDSVTVFCHTEDYK